MNEREDIFQMAGSFWAVVNAPENLVMHIQPAEPQGEGQAMTETMLQIYIVAPPPPIDIEVLSPRTSKWDLIWE